MSKEFSELFSRVKKLRSRYLNTLSAFRIYDSLARLSAPNKVGKKRANKNVKIFNNFKYFFVPVKEASRCYFFIELAKFFDKDNRTLSVFHVLDYAEKNISELTKQDFLNYHKDREILPGLFSKYKEMSLSDIKKIKRKINSKEVLINKLKNYRDQYLAHDDINKITVSINGSEIKQLFNLVKSIIEIFYLRLDFASNSYKNFDEEPAKDIEMLVKGLQEYEKNRIKEIEKRFKD